MQPTRLGKYLLLDRLAVGGMAEVYRGKLVGEQGFEKLVVIKKMLPQVAAKDEMVAAFIDEARLAALLQHENIIHVYDFGEMNGGYFIAMEYLFGQELRAVLDKSLAAKRRLPLADCLYITSRICDGLHYAHELKDLHQRLLDIIHRDISPQNIFLTYDGKIKIIDFGIAKTSLQSVQTQSGLVKGKLAYMSPEQAKGSELDRRSDIFATGAVLYEMITGCRMYLGSDTAQVLQKVIEADFSPPESIRPNIPTPVCAILNRALAKEKSDRYEDAGQMLSDIEECMFELSLRGNAHTLSVQMKDLFESEYAAETEDIQRVVAADASADGTIPKTRSDVSLPAEIGTPTPAGDFDGEGARTETISLSSGQPPAADRKPADPKPHQEESGTAGPKRVRPERRSTVRTTIINAIVTVLVVASMIWLVASLKSKIPQNPAAETPSARVADNPEDPRKVQPGTDQIAPQSQRLASTAPRRETASGTGTAHPESLAQPADKPSEASEPISDQPASDLEKPQASPPPIKHIASRSKRVASARSVAIKALLENAERNLNQYQLTSPEKDCAYFYFKEVLRMDPRNADARKGIRRIGDAYGRLADREIGRFAYEKAEAYVNKGLTVAPNNAHLLTLKKKLSRPHPLRLLDDVGDKVKDLFD